MKRRKIDFWFLDKTKKNILFNRCSPYQPPLPPTDPWPKQVVKPPEPNWDEELDKEPIPNPPKVALNFLSSIFQKIQ